MFKFKYIEVNLIEKIIKLAQRDKQRRIDQRYFKVMGFLVAKGFLYSIKEIPLSPNEYINLKDAVWAGRFVEPRILEVLPAAYERFKKHFSGDADTIEKTEGLQIFSIQTRNRQYFKKLERSNRSI